MKKRQAHKGIPEGFFEEEQGQRGFYGPVSHLIKKKPSTRWTHIEGPLKPALFDLTILNKEKDCWKKLLYNEALNLFFYRTTQTIQTAFRGANGDLLFFCHEGEGVFLTEYGLLNYSKSQYVVIPKCFTHAVIPHTNSSFVVIESLEGHFCAPERGLLGRNALYSENVLVRPDLKALKKYLRSQNLEFKKVAVFKKNEVTYFSYKDCIFDVEQWQGDLFPYTLHMKDIMPVMSHRVHLPPSAHTTFLTENFIVCSFLPRPLEQDADALKVPFYHQNTDYDEVIFYHKGRFFSRDHLQPGMMSLHPCGFPHGPHPKALKEIKNKTHTDEYAVMIDSKKDFKWDNSLKNLEIKDYWKSWQN